MPVVEFREMEYLRLAKQTAKTKASQEAQKIALRKQAEERAVSRLQFDREKFEFDATKAAIKFAREIKTISSDRSLNDTQKVEQVRLRLFGTEPEVSVK